jgi:hypothetical protein
MTLTTTIAGSITAKQVVALDAGSASFPAAFTSSLALTNGTGASQADLLWSDTRTLTASATENLDLAGSLTDAFAAVLTFVKVKAIYVSAAAANTNNVVVGNGSNPFLGIFTAGTDSVTLKPGYFVLWGGVGAGYTVTAATGDILKVANSAGGTSVTYSIMVVGTSA